jgi:hypothetical protein
LQVNIQLTTQVHVIDRWTDVLYTKSAGIDFCCLRHVASHTRDRLIVASDSVTTFELPPNTASHQKLQIPEDPSLFVVPIVGNANTFRVTLRGTGFSAHRLDARRSAFHNIIQIRGESGCCVLVSCRHVG